MCGDVPARECLGKMLATIKGQPGAACEGARRRALELHKAYTRALPLRQADAFEERVNVLLQEARLVDAHSTERQSARKYTNRAVFLLSAATALVMGVILHRIGTLRNLFRDEFAWYEKAFVKGTLKPGAMNKSVDVYEVAMCITYNAYYRLGFLWSDHLELTLPAAKFLINMLRIFPDDITALNWCGSATQLGQKEFLEFVGANESNVGDADARWAQWLNQQNKWRFLFKTPTQLSNSLAYTRIKDGIRTFVDMDSLLEGNMLYGLYSDGGLVQAALNYTSKRASLNEADLMYELIGEHVTFKQSCDLARDTYLQGNIGSFGISGAMSQLSGSQGATARNTDLGILAASFAVGGPIGLLWGAQLCIFKGFFNAKPPCPPPTTFTDPRIDDGSDEQSEPPS